MTEFIDVILRVNCKEKDSSYGFLIILSLWESDADIDTAQNVPCCCASPHGNHGTGTQWKQ